MAVESTKLALGKAGLGFFKDLFSGKSYRLYSGMTFGRTTGNELFPNDALISGRHFQITDLKGRIHLVDFGSSNGTLLNGQRVKPHNPTPLKDGDQIRFGNQTVTYSTTESFAQSPRPVNLPGFRPGRHETTSQWSSLYRLRWHASTAVLMTVLFLVGFFNTMGTPNPSKPPFDTKMLRIDSALIWAAIVLCMTVIHFHQAIILKRSRRFVLLLAPALIIAGISVAYLSKFELGLLTKESVNEIAEVCVEHYEERACSNALRHPPTLSPHLAAAVKSRLNTQFDLIRMQRSTASKTKPAQAAPEPWH